MVPMLGRPITELCPCQAGAPHGQGSAKIQSPEVPGPKPQHPRSWGQQSLGEWGRSVGMTTLFPEPSDAGEWEKGQNDPSAGPQGSCSFKAKSREQHLGARPESLRNTLLLLCPGMGSSLHLSQGQGLSYPPRLHPPPWPHSSQIGPDTADSLDPQQLPGTRGPVSPAAPPPPHSRPAAQEAVCSIPGNPHASSEGGAAQTGEARPQGVRPALSLPASESCLGQGLGGSKGGEQCPPTGRVLCPTQCHPRPRFSPRSLWRTKPQCLNLGLSPPQNQPLTPHPGNHQDSPPQLAPGPPSLWGASAQLPLHVSA